MSYCRFSSDNWRSDVYVYESDRGFETHVAAKKRVGEIPPLDRSLIRDKETADDFMKQYRAQMAALEVCELAPIGLAHDGESFTDESAAACLWRLLALRDEGYHVPDFAIATLREESTALTLLGPSSQVKP